MALLFLTSSLEPGLDGVGDYTRRLAFACLRFNQPCCAIALNDRHVDKSREVIETAGGLELPTLRLHPGLSWEKRMALARAFRFDHEVTRISLQFVSYGFNDKGIVLGLAGRLEPLVTGCPLHIMFHELWIGAGASEPFKERMVGRIQRYAIRKLTRQLRPRAVTTTNPYYAALLKKIRVTARELPLFGNIPTPAEGQLPTFPPALLQADIGDGRLIGLFFGTLHAEWKPEPFLSTLANAAAQMGLWPCLISAGRRGAAGDRLWAELESGYGHAIDFITVGERPAREISSLMQVADFGLAASPWYLLGKSGSVAAMLDHGLPVIVTREDGPPTGESIAPPSHPLLHYCDEELEAKLVAGLPRQPARDRVDEIARAFILFFFSGGK